MSPELDETIGRASGALVRRRGEDALWRDFHTLAGASCDWVTGFVAAATARCDMLRETAHESIRALYLRQRPSGGWGYNEDVPPDCDSTSWILLAAATTTQWRPSAISRALHYVRRHWRTSQKGFATYAPEDRIESYIAVPPEVTTGWLSAHTCVSAVAVQALLTHGVRDAMVADTIASLQEQQGPDGLWISYWWPGFAYATYHVLKALAIGGALSDRRWSKARRGILLRQNADGGWSDQKGMPSHAFASAMAILSLLLRPDNTTVRRVQRGAAYLIRTNVEGLWPAVPILRIPAPFIRVPAASDAWATDALGTGTIVTDVQQVFSSAAALWALLVTRDVLRFCSAWG
jgi:squalene-hopene/tetraprenyl-beta-curcumene cyclase